MELNLAVAFIAGLVSFLSPCVLPIIPGFLAYLAGASLKDAAAHRKEIILSSFFFVLGFSLVFAALGVLLNTVLEAVAYDVQIWFSRIGGLIVIFFGLYLTGLFHIPFFEREHKIFKASFFKSRYLTSMAFGAAFAAGWTPCVGAALGAILGLAATQPASAFILLISYTLGLGLPFIIVGIFASQAANFINRYAKFIKYVNIVFGILLILLGILVFTQSISLLANFDLLNKILLNE